MSSPVAVDIKEFIASQKLSAGSLLKSKGSSQLTAASGHSCGELESPTHFRNHVTLQAWFELRGELISDNCCLNVFDRAEPLKTKDHQRKDAGPGPNVAAAGQELFH